MADELSNIQSLSSAVDALTQKVNELYDAVSRVKGVAGSTITDVKGMINTQGGQIGLGNASRMQMPTQASFSYSPGNQQQGNFLSNSMGNFSSSGMAMNGGRFRGDANAVAFADAMGTVDPKGGGGGGLGIFNWLTGSAEAGTATYAALGAAKMVAGGAVAAFGAMPDTGLTLQRDLGYYQASLSAGRNANRGDIQRASLKALGNGLSSVGSDVIAANVLTSSGYTAGSKNYLSAMGEVGGAYKNLGIDNGAAAAAIAGLHSGATSAQMYGLGISTYDAKTGTQRSVGDIAKDLMNRMTGGRKDISVQDINNSLQMGALGANLKASGLDQATQDMIVASMRNQVQGGTGELNQGNTSYGGANNKNSVLNATGQMNASQTDVMQAATGGMVAGFQAATSTVVALNKMLEVVAPVLGAVKGYTSGVMGSNVGQGLVDAAPIFASAVSDFATAIAKATGAGGGTSGYGAAFGIKGGAAPVAAAAGAAVTAGYGATDGSMWAGTNGKHTGVDYAMKVGTPVTATMSGKVVQVDLNTDYGKSILIENAESGYQTLYAHLSAENVKVGDSVTAGQTIGKSGDTGNASGPHLHYEVRNGKNNPVDPKTISSGGMLSAALGSGNTMALLSASAPLPGYSASVKAGSTTSGSLPANADSNLVSILTQAGFSGSGLATAYAVAKAESGGRATAYNGNTKTGDQSYGLFQINMLGSLGPDRRKRFGLSSNQDLLDPATNAQVAYAMSHGGTNWGPWSTYTNGSYKKFLNTPATGGGTSGYGGAGLGGSIAGSVVNNFNMPITLQTGNDAELMRVAKKIQTLISNTHDISVMGAS